MFNNLNLVSNDSFLGTNSEVKSVNSGFDYNSFYRAIVKSNHDPDNLGRVQIYIPSLHSNLSTTNQYPWAYPGCFTGFGNQVGQFFLPPVGSVVFVTFEYSDEHRPIYFGGIPTVYDEGKQQSYGNKINYGLPKDVTNDDIPTEYTGSQAIVYKSPSGAIIYMDDFSYHRKVVVKDSAGQMVSMDSWKNSDGELVKQLKVFVDDKNYMLFEPTKLTWVIDGEVTVFDKMNPPGSGGGTDDYSELINKPQINGVTLLGNKTASQLGLQTTIEFATNADIDKVISL